MPRSPLFGRRIQIAGSIPADTAIATGESVRQARELVVALVTDLMHKGATFVVPVDDEKFREDGFPICFDWLVWETLQKNLSVRPANAPNPLAFAIQHYKTEDQIPSRHATLWDSLRGSDLVQIDTGNQWNMASKRMEIQAQHGDILLTLGGCEGVLFLANLYHNAGRPVIPLNLPLCAEGRGSRKLFEYALTSANTQRLFRTQNTSPHGWINRINFGVRHDVGERARLIGELLEDLERPTAFAVRLLDPNHADYPAVQAFFDTVVGPVVEGELGYKLVVVDGEQASEYARIDQEIFQKLHRSSVILADITGGRPNCFIELGYALGRGLPTMLLARDGTPHPFDISSVAAHHWNPAGTAQERRAAFRRYWEATINRPPLISGEPLIS